MSVGGRALGFSLLPPSCFQGCFVKMADFRPAPSVARQVLFTSAAFHSLLLVGNVWKPFWALTPYFRLEATCFHLLVPPDPTSPSVVTPTALSLYSPYLIPLQFYKYVLEPCWATFRGSLKLTARNFSAFLYVSLPR